MKYLNEVVEPQWNCTVEEARKNGGESVIQNLKLKLELKEKRILEKNEFKTGYGISKIIAKRKKEGHDPKEILYQIADTLVFGKITQTFGPEKSKRVELEKDGYVAFINEYWKDDKYN